MTWVKICGTTNLEDAQLAAEAGADALGFVFYEKSPRYIDPRKAREIVPELPPHVEKVGVFVDESFEQIRELVDQVELTAVQLYGLHSWKGIEAPFASSDPRRQLKVILALPAEELSEADFLITGVDILHALMLDAGTRAQPGGTGKTFNWNKAYGRIQELGLTLPVIVAGGLNPLNVREAVQLFRPYGVDVASGVEAEPGKKDPEKVRAFIAAVRKVDRSGAS